MVITLSDREIAGKIARGGLFLHSLYLRGQTYQKSPLQCFRCLAEGHVAARCSTTVPPKCMNCNGDHESRLCDQPRGPPRCFNCINVDRKANDGKDVDQEAAKFNHHLTSTKCPLWQTKKRPTDQPQGKIITLSCQVKIDQITAETLITHRYSSHQPHHPHPHPPTPPP